MRESAVEQSIRTVIHSQSARLRSARLPPRTKTLSSPATTRLRNVAPRNTEITSQVWYTNPAISRAMNTMKKMEIISTALIC
jgi:hypothetical protein